MIYTSNYKNATSIKNTISISGDRGKKNNYAGPYCKDLAPKKDMWLKWNANKGILPEIDNNRFYISNYLKDTLSVIDPAKLYGGLDNYTLLCYEESNEFCHRHIVAYWLEDTLGVIVPEVSFIENEIVYLERPEYIKEIYDNEKVLLKK